jgi:hypothetical protein
LDYESDAKSGGRHGRNKESDRQLLDAPLTLNVRTNILSPSHVLQLSYINIKVYKTNK